MNRTIASCPECGFPISAEYEGQNAVCANCQAELTAIKQEGVTIPTPLFAGLLGFGLGVLLGPALIASTDEGRKWLERQGRAAISR